MAGLLVQFFFYALCFTTFTSGFALFAERTYQWQGHPFSPREVGFLFAYAGFLGIVLQGGLIKGLVRRLGEPLLTLLGFASLAVSYLALGLSHTVVQLGVIATVSSFGNGVLRPSLTSLVSQCAGPHEQGTVLGLTQSLNAVAAIVAPALAGVLIERQQLSLWAFTAAASAALGLVFCRWGSSRATTAAKQAPAA
jgi:MFS family permease